MRLNKYFFIAFTAFVTLPACSGPPRMTADEIYELKTSGENGDHDSYRILSANYDVQNDYELRDYWWKRCLEVKYPYCLANEADSKQMKVKYSKLSYKERKLLLAQASKLIDMAIKERQRRVEEELKGDYEIKKNIIAEIEKLKNSE
jgi:hypothetical protein